jgi:Ca2+-binding RTX toxin-like protein
MPRSTRVLCLAAAALLTAAAPATAGTVGAEPGNGNVFRAAPGEANDVSVEDTGYRDGVLWTSIVDTGAPVIATDPCVPGPSASCPGGVRLYLGNRDDKGRTTSLIRIGYVYGEGGDDLVKSDGIQAHGYGGPGDDEVVVSAHDGYAYGGTGNDRLTGNAGEYNLLHGDAGDDVLVQGGTCAAMYGDGGADTLLGHASGCFRGRASQIGDTGADALIVSSSGEAGQPWLLDGGDGADYIVGGGGRDEITAGAGADFVNAAVDGVADTIACGSGRDTVRADRQDTVAADCELVTIVG